MAESPKLIQAFSNIKIRSNRKNFDTANNNSNNSNNTAVYGVFHSTNISNYTNNNINSNISSQINSYSSNNTIDEQRKSSSRYRDSSSSTTNTERRRATFKRTESCDVPNSSSSTSNNKPNTNNMRSRQNLTDKSNIVKNIPPKPTSYQQVHSNNNNYNYYDNNEQLVNETNYNNNNNNNNNNESYITHVRPVTARSLPNKIVKEQEFSDDSSMSRTNSEKLRNLSNSKGINHSYSIDDQYENNDKLEVESNKSYKHVSSVQKYSRRMQKEDNYYDNSQETDYSNVYMGGGGVGRTSRNDSITNLPITITGATETRNSNATINSQNSKMDTLHYGLKTTTLFTTKYECIGTPKTGSDTSIKNIPDSSKLSTRSKSVSNISDKVAFTSQSQITKFMHNKSSNQNSNSNLSSNNSSNANSTYNYDEQPSSTKYKASNTENYNHNSNTNNNNHNNSKSIKNSTLSVNNIDIRNRIIEKIYSNKHYTTNEDVEVNFDQFNTDDFIRNCKSNSNNNHISNNNNSNLHNFINITDSIFLGNMASIKNERKMCRLNIEYLIDMTNMRPDDLNRQTLGKLPCLCKQQHSRLYLSVEILDTNFKTLFNCFTEINKFIQKARKADKNVLIFSKDFAAQHLICACAQYIMLEYEMTLENALNIITKKISTTNTLFIEKCYIEYLNNFESYLRHLSISLYGSSGKVLNRSNSISSTTNDFIRVSKNLKLAQKPTTDDDKSNDSDDKTKDDDEIDTNTKSISRIKDKRFTELSFSSPTDSTNNLKMAWM